MPYSSKKTGKNKITVYKKDSGEVVGHTTPANYNAYMAALHIHSGDNAAHGGMVEMPKGEFIKEHERLIPQLEGQEKKEQSEELKDVRGYAEGGIVSPYPEVKQEKEEMEPGGAYDEGNDPEFESAPHMAEGGILGFDPDKLQGDLTAGTSDQKRPMPIDFNPVPIPSTPPIQNVPRGTMAKTPINQKLPGMPPSMTADELSNYIQGQKGKIGQFGAQNQMNLANELENRRNSLGYKATIGLKGFADALMQGVAGAGNPGFQREFENQEANAGNQRLNALQGANTANIQQINSEMALDAKNPTSPISRSIQKAYGGTLESLGVSKNDIPNLSAEMASDFLNKRITLADVNNKLELEKAVAEASLGEKQQERKLGAMQDLSKMGILRRMFSPEAKGLEEQAGLRKPSISMPSVGQVYKGHVFMGGDPSKAESWRKQ